LQDKRNIVITGGNRGIGLGLFKSFSLHHNVIITVRDEAKGIDALSKLNSEDNKSKYVIMDLEDSNSIENAKEIIEKEFGCVDILINNAGIFIKDYEVSAIETDLESILKTFNINTLGALRVCKAMVPLMNESGRIINISSGMGQLDHMESGSTAYRLSKTSLNALSKILSNELSSCGIKVNTICPGWVKTDMGGPNATLSVEESSSKIVDFALKKDFPSGKFLRHGHVIPW
tara:strand:- start:683 stop:1378 length:696 start_codon:yes stop_codon:yes gene_type:complete